jgi:hypothetical protein
MDENEWFESADPEAMFAGIQNRIAERKQRLFACACVRSVWHNLRDESFRRLAELAEEVADGRASIDRLESEGKILFEADPHISFVRVLNNPPVSAMVAARNLGFRAVPLSIGQVVRFALLSAAPCEPGGSTADSPLQGSEAKQAHARLLADLFRDIVGNPFRPITLHPDWLAWDDGIVRRLAEAMYEGRRFQELPVLADALEDAGCDVPEVLDHLRGRGVHASGCWALDLARGV